MEDIDPDENAAAFKTYVLERSRDPNDIPSARQRALMACIVLPNAIQKWMVEAGAIALKQRFLPPSNMLAMQFKSLSQGASMGDAADDFFNAGVAQWERTQDAICAGIHSCPRCGGFGMVKEDEKDCWQCDGLGLLDANGNPCEI